MGLRIFKRLRDLIDVDAANIGDGKVPVYRTASGKHEYEVVGGAAADVTVDITQAAHGLAVGDVVRLSGTTYIKAIASSAAAAEAVGVVSAVASANAFTLTLSGDITGLSGLTAGAVYFLSDSTAGLLTATEPTAAGSVTKPLLIAYSTTAGYVFNFRGLLLEAALTASDVPIVDTAADFTATDVEGALAELQSDNEAHVAAADPHTGYVLESLFDANTILKADSDNTPEALTMGASTILARLAAGDIVAATVSETLDLLGLPQQQEMCWGNNLPGIAAASGAGIVNTRRAHGWRVVAPRSGTLSEMYVLILTSTATNIEVGILDTASGGTRTRLWTTGSIACPAVGWASLGNPDLAVTAGDAFDFYINSDNTTATYGRVGSFTSGSYAAYNLPASVFSPASIPTRNYVTWQRSTVEFPIAPTIADTTLSGYIYGYSVVGLIT